MKSTGLSDYLKNIGQKVGFDFVISDSAVVTTWCSVDMPVTYKLKVENEDKQWRMEIKTLLTF